MKFKYKQAIPNAMKEALKNKNSKIAVQKRVFLGKINEKICPNCKAAYDARKSKGICIKCFELIPKGY